jgi:hypothetical protein
LLQFISKLGVRVFEMDPTKRVMPGRKSKRKAKPIVDVSDSKVRDRKRKRRPVLDCDEVYDIKPLQQLSPTRLEENPDSVPAPNSAYEEEFTGEDEPEGAEEDECDTESKWDFMETISLEGIPQDLAAMMLDECPMLQGCRAMYPAKFFRSVVGLCDQGTPVGKVLKETPVTVKEVLKIWKVGTKANRYPIDKCQNSEQLLLFCDQYAKVYGGKPNNRAFSMRFLCACYASFVYNLPVDWASEAANRRKKKE